MNQSLTPRLPKNPLLPDSIDTNGSRHAERSDKARSADRFQDDSQHAWLFAGTAQSGESVGIGSRQSRTRRPVATQEGTEASRCARKARYTPKCHRRVARTHQIYRDLDDRGFVAGWRDCGFALGENPSGSNRNRGAFLRRRIRRYQNRCWSQERSARFARNLAGGPGRGVATVKTSKSGRPGFHEGKRRSGEPAESVAAATQAVDQEAWIARFHRFPELSHHALQPDEQHWRPA